jgi:hypothetical protein
MREEVPSLPPPLESDRRFRVEAARLLLLPPLLLLLLLL